MRRLLSYHDTLYPRVPCSRCTVPGILVLETFRIAVDCIGTLAEAHTQQDCEGVTDLSAPLNLVPNVEIVPQFSIFFVLVRLGDASMVQYDLYGKAVPERSPCLLHVSFGRSCMPAESTAAAIPAPVNMCSAPVVIQGIHIIVIGGIDTFCSCSVARADM